MSSRAVKSGSTVRTTAGPLRVTVVGDTVVSEEGLATIVARDKRYVVSGSAHTFREANKLVQQHPPDLLLIEPFMENQDGIRWIKDLVAKLPRTRILVVSRQSEQMYEERALRAGASGYWMKNSSAGELMRAMEVVVSGETYVNPQIGSRAVQRFAGRERSTPGRLHSLSVRELAVFSLIAAGQGVGEIARKLGISRKTVDSHCEKIKAKVEYADAEALRRGARECLGALLRQAPE